MDVNRELITFRDERLAEATHEDIRDLISLSHEHATGGKHFRAHFAHAGWCIAGGDANDPRIARAASAFEWLQASALVHDDLIDDSDTRRGRTTIHRSHGMETAVLVGDLLLTWADQALNEAAPATADWDIAAGVRWWDRCKNEVIAGQYLDVTAESRNVISVEAAFEVITLKSAKYTIERPLHVGAALAGAGADLLAAMTAYAIPLGQAFQLRDDLLGVFGDPSITGKPAGDDLREGKRTVLVAHAAAVAGNEAVVTLLGREDTVAELTALLVETGARDTVEADIARLESEARRALDDFAPEHRERLDDLATAATRREH